jgi:hypothetical protein
MRWESVQHKKKSDFKRLVGVTPAVFKQMVKEVKRKRKRRKQKKKRGRPFKMSEEDQILLTLMYWREYRTMYHIGHAYNISEAAVCRTIQRIENILSKSKEFTLPGKKQLTKSNQEYEVVIVDATESPIERPKKNSTGIIPAKRSGIH